VDVSKTGGALPKLQEQEGEKMKTCWVVKTPGNRLMITEGTVAETRKEAISNAVWNWSRCEWKDLKHEGYTVVKLKIKEVK